MCQRHGVDAARAIRARRGSATVDATIGGVARGTIQAAVEESALPPFPIEERDEARLLEELVGRLDTLAADLRQAMDDSADDAATEDVFIEVTRGVEKQRWMLQAHLAGR